MKTFSWCKKTTPLAVSLYQAQLELDHQKANSKEFLESIAKAVVAEVEHKGKTPTMHSVRAKLSSEKVYQPIDTAPKSRKGTVISKESVVGDIQKTLGIDLNIGTLTNANKADLEAVSEKVAQLRMAVIQHAPRDQVLELLGEVEDAEMDAISGGASPSTVARVEADTEKVLENAEMQAESADNLEENS